MNNRYVIGAIAGDIIGSAYEFHNTNSMDFEMFIPGTYFTDDSVLTIATMDVLLNDGDYTDTYQKYSRLYPHRGYGGHYKEWVYSDDPKPYNSFGNGSAMRASPIGWYCSTLEEVLDEAEKSARVTHNHPEGIKGAQAAASAVFLARSGATKEEIQQYITTQFHYDLDRSLDDIRPGYQFEVSCQKSVPEAIIAFLESRDFENAIRLAVSLGGDSDTIACITGGIAEAYYRKIPDHIFEMVRIILGPDLMREVLDPFSLEYGNVIK